MQFLTLDIGKLAQQGYQCTEKNKKDQGIGNTLFSMLLGTDYTVEILFVYIPGGPALSSTSVSTKLIRAVTRLDRSS